MPTYQYTCTECGQPLEVVQKFTDDPLTECASCGGRLRKVFSAVGIVFKGSGFYRNDSRAEDAQNDSRGGSDSAAKSDSSSEKTDSGSEKSDAGSNDGESSAASSSSGTSDSSSSSGGGEGASGSGSTSGSSQGQTEKVA